MTSAVNLKFLSLWPQARLGTSNSKPHQNHNVASVPLIPKFASEVPRVLANFGIGTLATPQPACAQGRIRAGANLALLCLSDLGGREYSPHSSSAAQSLRLK